MLLAHVSFVAAVATSDVQLEWNAPTGCPSATEVAARIDALREPDGVSIVARVDVTASADGFAAAIAIDRAGVQHRREVVGASCSDVADAAAIIVAIGIDPADRESAPPVDPIPAPSSPKAEETETSGDSRAPPPVRGDARAAPREGPPASPATGSPRSIDPPRLGLRIAAGPLVRTTPRVTGAFALGLAALWRRARADVIVSYAMPTTTTRAGDLGVRAQMWSVGVGGAWTPSVSIVEFPLHAGLEIGGVVATGLGLDRASTQHGLWLGATVGPGLAIAPHRRVAVVLDPALLLGLVRPRFAARDADGDRSLFRPPIVGVRVLAGVEVRFL